MMPVLVLCVLGLVESGNAQDIDLDADVMLILNEQYKKLNEDLLDIDIDGSINGPRPSYCPPVELHNARVLYEGSTSVEQNGATALDEWYHNGQKNESITVLLAQTTERTTTVTSQVLKGVRTILSGHVSAQIPASEAMGVGFKGGTLLDIAIDIRTRTTKTVTDTETFKVQKTFSVPPQKSVHVVWVIVESKMLASWTAVVTLTGYVRTWYTKDEQKQEACEHICNFYNYGMKDMVQLNGTHCGFKVSGFTKIEGGVDSQISVIERPLRYRSRPSIP